MKEKKTTGVQSKYYTFTTEMKQEWEKEVQKENTCWGKQAENVQ